MIDSERGRGYWKFNNTLLKDKDYVSLIKIQLTMKRTYVSNENNLTHGNISNKEIQFNINDQLFLETLLMMIRGNTIKYSSEKKKKYKKRKKNTRRRHKTP